MWVPTLQFDEHTALLISGLVQIIEQNISNYILFTAEVFKEFKHIWSSWQHV